MFGFFSYPSFLNISPRDVINKRIDENGTWDLLPEWEPATVHLANATNTPHS
jgi:hypothetical protein